MEELTQREWEVAAMVFFHVDIEASRSKDFSQYPSQKKNPTYSLRVSLPGDLL